MALGYALLEPSGLIPILVSEGWPSTVFTSNLYALECELLLHLVQTYSWSSEILRTLCSPGWLQTTFWAWRHGLHSWLNVRNR